MQFNPEHLTATVRALYNEGSGYWTLVVKSAIQENIKDINFLTDMVFYLHHPESLGRPLRIHETKLIGEWKRYRGLIRFIRSKLESLSWGDDEDSLHVCPHSFWDHISNENDIPGLPIAPSQTKVHVHV